MKLWIREWGLLYIEKFAGAFWESSFSVLWKCLQKQGLLSSLNANEKSWGSHSCSQPISYDYKWVLPEDGMVLWVAEQRYRTRYVSGTCVLDHCFYRCMFWTLLLFQTLLQQLLLVFFLFTDNIPLYSGYSKCVGFFHIKTNLLWLSILFQLEHFFSSPLFQNFLYFFAFLSCFNPV